MRGTRAETHMIKKVEPRARKKTGVVCRKEVGHVLSQVSICAHGNDDYYHDNDNTGKEYANKSLCSPLLISI